MSLAQKECVPCRGDATVLNREEAETLLKQISGWELSDDARWITRNYTFKNFKTTLAFVNRVGEVAETVGHHPDIYFTWGKCRISIQTHKINGLHESDFILAAKIDTVLEA